MQIELLSPSISSQDFSGLVKLLIECVHAGASIGFMAPLSADEAANYWHKVIAEISLNQRSILVARLAPGGAIVGSAQIAFETRANGRHRAEVQKVMVQLEQRGHGIATAMMAEVEAVAHARKISLLFLDTSEGNGGARAFYEKLGYIYVGGIPGYALDPDGKPAKNAIFYKLAGVGDADAFTASTT
jgi:ribosomal protein S18 acetylase RimI-like enzyme